MTVNEQYAFDPVTKELKTGGDAKSCSPGGIGPIIYQRMKKYAKEDLIAQIEIDTDYEDPFSDFLTRSTKVSLYLKEIGIKPGDVIATCSPNNRNNTTVILGSIFIGATFASIDPILSLEHTIYLLKIVEPKAIFVSEDSTDMIEKALTFINNNCKLIVLQKHNSFENMPQIFDRISSQKLSSFKPLFIEDTSSTICILFSSGTTGLPKGTCISHDYINCNILNSKFDLFENKKGKNILCFTTLYWFSGLVATLNGCTSGFRVLKCSKFNAEKIWDYVDKYQVNMLYMSYYHCINAFEYLNAPHNSITQMVIVGGQINYDKQIKYSQMLPSAEIVNTYGMTEISVVSVNHDCLNCSSGKPLQKNQIVKIVDPETEEALDLNKVGEIRVKFKFQMNGYYKEDSKDCWDADGFFKTGDIGYLNDNYDLYIIDRIKEMFKFRSWHVIPAKIERHLIKHESVAHCVVIGVPHEIDDNHAMAIIVLKNNCTASPEELLKYSNDVMDNIHQIRAGIRLVPKSAIPFTATGKINRHMLKAQILDSN